MIRVSVQFGGSSRDRQEGATAAASQSLLFQLSLRGVFAMLDRYWSTEATLNFLPRQTRPSPGEMLWRDTLKLRKVLNFLVDTLLGYALLVFVTSYNLNSDFKADRASLPAEHYPPGMSS
jgi:hypothetical protein